MADISVSSQVFVFFAMIVLGVMCGAVFDIFRGIRRMKKVAGGVVAVQDLLFWLSELVLVYMVTFWLNYAQVRAFELVALVIGSFIYFMTVSRYVIAFVHKTANIVWKTVAVILKPVRLAMGFLGQKLSSVIAGIKHKTKQLFAKLKPNVNIKQKITEVFDKRYKLLKKRVK